MIIEMTPHVTISVQRESLTLTHAASSSLISESVMFPPETALSFIPLHYGLAKHLFSQAKPTFCSLVWYLL